MYSNVKNKVLYYMNHFYVAYILTRLNRRMMLI